MSLLETTAGKVSAVLGAVLVLAAVVSGAWGVFGRVFGAKLTTLPDDFSAHIEQEQAWHSEDAVGDSITANNSEELHDHIRRIEAKQAIVETVFFTEQCLENDYRMLAAQHLIRACDSLGISRRPGDTPPALEPER